MIYHHLRPRFTADSRGVAVDTSANILSVTGLGAPEGGRVRARLEESFHMRSSNTTRRSFPNAITSWTMAAALGLMSSAVSSQAAEPGAGGLDVVPVRQNFYMIAGAGGN